MDNARCRGPRGPYMGSYGPYLTLNEERKGFPEAKRRLRGYSTEALRKEYLEMQKASFGMFGRNAAQAGNLVAVELLSRRCPEIPNIFGPIRVRRLRSLR